MMNSVWDLPAGALVEMLGRAAAKSAVSGSGMVQDVTHSMDVEDTRYLYGVAIARLEGKKPPFVAGDKVREKTGGGSENPVRQIERVHYTCEGRYNARAPHKFALQFKGAEHLRWAEEFELAPAVS